MRKTNRKLDNQLREMLTEVCEVVLKDIPGFLWITHVVNYGHFPKSLNIVCVFDTHRSLNAFKVSKDHNVISALIQKNLRSLNIGVNSIAGHLSFDIEENFNRKNVGR